MHWVRRSRSAIEHWLAPQSMKTLAPEISPDRPFACITIQGGGIYGLSLLGQLEAVRRRGLSPVALAGTSAGAIVATLFWARLTPDAVLS